MFESGGPHDVWLGGEQRRVVRRNRRGGLLPDGMKKWRHHRQPSLLLEDTGELLHPTGRLHLVCEEGLTEDTLNGLLAHILDTHALDRHLSTEHVHTLGVTDEGRRFDILQLLGKLSELEGVVRAEPELRMPLRRNAALYPWQWDLHGRVDPFTRPTINPGVRLPQAHGLSRGRKDIVVAVIDDGFDLDHPCFKGVKISDKAMDAETGKIGLEHVRPDNLAFHGTPTAGVALAGEHSETRGIAPGCTLLPIRMDLHGQQAAVAPGPMIRAVQHASANADVLICAFNNLPSSVNLIALPLSLTLVAAANRGGRRKNGLVIVFPSGNDGLPISLDPQDNTRGVVFYDTRKKKLRRHPPGTALRGNFCSVPGVLGVGGVTSHLRRAAFSSFGEGLDIVAPTNNGHAIHWYGASRSADGINYNRSYRGHQPIAPANRPGFGTAQQRLKPNQQQTGACEHLYCWWGGTSHCAPIIGGVAALMLSVNPLLSAEQVRIILKETARRDLDPGAYIPHDHNLNGNGPHFTNGWSQWFGHGLVDAEAAVWRAREFVPPASKTQVSCC